MKPLNAFLRKLSPNNSGKCSKLGSLKLQLTLLRSVLTAALLQPKLCSPGLHSKESLYMSQLLHRSNLHCPSLLEKARLQWRKMRLTLCNPLLSANTREHKLVLEHQPLTQLSHQSLLQHLTSTFHPLLMIELACIKKQSMRY